MIIGYFIICILVNFVTNEKWAVLYATSSGIHNYRHQADVLHAYQVLTNTDFDPKRIIMMLTDDIAYNEKNTKNGSIYNRPFGQDVYKDAVIDYRGIDSNKNTFFSVLSGNSRNLRNLGSGKVLNVTKDDTVLIYIVGHGSTYIIYTYDGIIRADVLVDSINKLAEKCKSLFILVDTCYAGSLFEELNRFLNKNVFIITSTGPLLPSYACYFDEDLNEYIGDEFGTAIFENVERLEKIESLYNVVDIETQKSTVCFFGNKTYLSHTVSEYFGESYDSPYTRISTIRSNDLDKSSSPSYNVQLTRLLNIYKKTKNENDRKRFIETQSMYNYIENMFESLKTEIENQNKIISRNSDPFTCYTNVVENFIKNCIHPNKFNIVTKYIGSFYKMCKEGHHSDLLIFHINYYCSELHTIINKDQLLY